MTIKLATNDKIAETSSKGNQEKWLEDGYWYKLDQFGYEALAEVMTSKLLEFSNIEKETPFTFVRYEMQIINLHGFERVACVSKNFLKKNQSIVTVNTLFKKHSDISIKKKLARLPSDKKRVEYLANTISGITGLKEFPRYLTLLFEIDSLILNDDRHLNNIAVIREGNKYDYCPIFDNGAGLLSNMQILRTDIEPKGLMKSLTASPFGMTFNRELKSTRALFGSVLELPRFSKDKLQELLSPLLEYYPKRDSGVITDRVIECILERQNQL